MSFSKHICSIVFITLFGLLIDGQVTLPMIPTNSCIGHQLATATYSTRVSLDTGASSVLQGSFWNQSGAIWTFSTDSQDVRLDLRESLNAVKLNHNGSTWTLTVADGIQEGLSPTVTIKDIAVSAPSPSSTSEATTTIGSSATTVNAKRKPPNPKAPISKGAKFHPRVTPYTLSVGGAWACLQIPSISTLKPSTQIPKPTMTTPSPTVTTNSALASMCSNNQISAVGQSWTSFGVATYMSSLLAAAAPTPGSQVDGVAVMHNDVNPPGPRCTYSSKCDSVTCSDVKDYNAGSEIAVQRFLGYQAVINLNNYLNTLMVTVMNAGLINSLMNAKLVTTFFTNPFPQKTWEQVVGGFTPMLGMLSGLLSPVIPWLSPVITGTTGFVNAMVANFAMQDMKPVEDKRFSEFATLSEFVATYLKNTIVGIERVYNRTIGNGATADSWAGSDKGYFTSGLWVDSDHAQDLGTNLLNNFIRIFTYKVINFAFKDSGCFIIYVPYGVPLKDIGGNMMDGIDEDYCKTSLIWTDQLGNLTICDAPGGMARIFNAGNMNVDRSLNNGVPSGWDAPFEVLPKEYFNITGAIRGSVASWKAGDFDYDASQPFQAAFDSGGEGLSADKVKEIAAMPINAETAGFFNVPVCATYDLRTFPPAKGWQNDNTFCKGNAFGGSPNSKRRFIDNVGHVVEKVLFNPAPYQKTYFHPGLMYPYGDVYGLTVSSPNAAGYLPGQCGVHLTQYQKNEGPGRDTSVYRWYVRIGDHQGMIISKGIRELREAPTGEWIEFHSLLPHPLRIKPGAWDSDPPTFSYPGSPDWLGDDKAHGCNFNADKYDSGKLEMDCGFACPE